jgi:UMF1 family MFS transporter
METPNAVIDTPEFEGGKYNKKTQNAWAFYDWANSVYPLVITTAIFPLFYEDHTSVKNAAGVVINDKVEFFGALMTNTSLITYVGAAYFLLICFMVPLLSGVADYSGSKKKFLRFFCYLGSISCMALYFFDKSYLEWSMLIYAMAGIGFWSSLVFYNAYLPEIAATKDHDKLSAKGFSMGYIGSVILLLVCLVLVMVLKVDAKISFVITGLWWIGFSHVTYPKLPVGLTRPKEKGMIWKGFKELKMVFRQVRKTKRLKRYLISFFIYSMAVQTIMIMAVYFGQKEVGVPTEGLIISVLLIQLIAIPGAYLTSKLSNNVGNIKALIVVVVIWVIICLSALMVYDVIHFYIIAGFVGLVMGGIQSLSRSTYSKYLPEGTKDTSSFFSFYDVSEKLGIVIGMLSYGLIEEFTGSMRNSIAALTIFFIVGLVILFTVPKEEVPINESK